MVLENRKEETMEIERKYKVLEIPSNLEQNERLIIEQGYLCNNPVLRIRKSNSNYYLTYKSKTDTKVQQEGSAIINNETELPLTEEAYLILKKKIEGNVIYKTRYRIPLWEGLIAELDVFGGALSGLIMAEVEFPDEKSANDFVPPSWFGKELSADQRFSNYYLSQLSSIDDLHQNKND